MKETRDYTPQDEQTFIYTIEVTETRKATGLITSDADAETTQEILLNTFREHDDSIEIVDFRVASEEEIQELSEIYASMDENKTIN